MGHDPTKGITPFTETGTGENNGAALPRATEAAQELPPVKPPIEAATQMIEPPQVTPAIATPDAQPAPLEDHAIQLDHSRGEFFIVVTSPKDRDGIPIPREIEYRPVAKANISDEAAALQIELEKTLTILKILFPPSWNQVQFKIYFDKLSGIAVMGLGQNQYAFGKLSLDALKSEILAMEGTRVKNRYGNKLLSWAIGFIVPLISIYLTMRFFPDLFPTWITEKREFVTLVAGSLFGTWLSFFVRKVELRFEDLAALEKDLLSPSTRLIFVAGLTTVIGLIFSTKLAVITIGTFDTNFLISGTRALIIGMFCGIAETSLSSVVTTRAADFIGAAGKTGSAGAGTPAGRAT